MASTINVVSTPISGQTKVGLILGLRWVRIEYPTLAQMFGIHLLAICSCLNVYTVGGCQSWARYS